jgi:hypothetical protein
MSEFPTEKQVAKKFVSMYVRKNSIFEVQPHVWQNSILQIFVYEDT